MTIRALELEGAWVFDPQVFSDERGAFYEWFQDSTFTEVTGESFNLAQANCSKSNKGVIRGIHYADIPPGQAKYVTCFSGSVLDILVDIRRGSPTFGKWVSVELSASNHKVINIPSGFGHAFMALEDNSTFVYLCDQRYNPENEHDIHPLDPTIGIEWPQGIDPLLSPKDAAAPSFLEIQERLPIYEPKVTE